MAGCCRHQGSGIPHYLQPAQSSEWLRAAENSKHVLFSSISSNRCTQSKRTWEPGLWSSSPHSWMMPLTPYWPMLSFAFLFLPHERQGRSCKRGSREGRGRKLWRLFNQEKGCSLPASVKEFRTPALLAGLRWDAEHSPFLPLAPGQPKLMASWLPAAPCSPGLQVQIPRQDTLLSSWESTGVPVSDAGLGFDPRNQTLSIKNET